MRLTGTELKINLHMEPMGEIHLSGCEFSLQAYATGRGYEIRKEQCIQVDDDNYIVLVDTAKTGAGAIKLKMTIDLPDADFNDGKRREVLLITTNISVGK